MSFDLDQLERTIACQGPVIRVALAEVRGSVPREAGTAMLVWQDGQAGTIGGGALEFEAIKRAHALLADQATREVLVQPLGPGLGQCCGGAVTLLFERFAEAPSPTEFPRLVPLSARDAPSEALRARAQAAHQTQCAEGYLIEPLARSGHPLWIWGAGHVGRALVTVLAPLPEFAITWIDTSAARFPDARPESVDVLTAADPARAVMHAPLHADHLILTYSHDIDLSLCHATLQRGFRSCGLIGSATKWARFRTRLEALGHSDAQISRITCPIGDPKLGKHPQAIAVGVASGLLIEHMHKEHADVPRREGRG